MSLLIGLRSCQHLESRPHAFRIIMRKSHIAEGRLRGTEPENHSVRDWIAIRALNHEVHSAFHACRLLLGLVVGWGADRVLGVLITR